MYCTALKTDSSLSRIEEKKLEICSNEDICNFVLNLTSYVQRKYTTEYFSMLAFSFFCIGLEGKPMKPTQHLQAHKLLQVHSQRK